MGIQKQEADVFGANSNKSMQLQENQIELSCLQRITLGLNYIPDPSSISLSLKFGFKHVIDILSPISVAMWKIDSALTWTLSAFDGEEFALPAPFANWSELNDQAILIRHPLCIYTSDVESREIAHVHWIIPFVYPGGYCYSLHVLTPKMNYPKETIEIFLTAFAFLLIKSDHSDELFHAQVNGNEQKGSGLPMSQRQIEILELSSQGLSYSQIARRMGFSESTIKQDAMKIFRILGVHNKSEAIKSFRF